MYSNLCKSKVCRFEIVWYTNVSHFTNQTSWYSTFKSLMENLKHTQHGQNKVYQLPCPLQPVSAISVSSLSPPTFPSSRMFIKFTYKCILYNFDIHVTYPRKFPSISFQGVSQPVRGSHYFEVFHNKLILFILEHHLNRIIKPYLLCLSPLALSLPLSIIQPSFTLWNRYIWCYSLNISWNCPLEPLGPEVFFVVRFLTSV